MQLTANTVLVTGGGSGIGRALAHAFHARGNQVIVAGRRVAELEETCAGRAGMHALPLDQDRPEAIAAFAARVLADFPALDVLINNAGIQRVEDLASGSTADAEATVRTNLLGPIWLTAAFLPALLARPKAAILNVTSGLAFVPLAQTPTYGATKAALHSYTQALRFQLRATQVQVIELVPPWVQTDLQGAGRSHDPRAMPLADYIAETMALLEQQPDAAEILVERVKPMRHAEREGRFDAFFTTFNEARAAEARKP